MPKLDKTTDKMPSSPIKPSSPIPITTGRNRSQTLDHLPQHHPPSHRSIILRSRISQSHVDTVPLEPDPSASPDPGPPAADINAPLHTVDSLRLQVIRDKEGKTLGLKLVDINSVKPRRANIWAPLPIGKENTGLVFDVENGEAMQELYTKASLTIGSGRIMGIMFAPPTADAGGIARDADWSFLEDEIEKKEPEKQAKDGADDAKLNDNQLLLLLRDLDLEN
ncbi:hypothetical protein IL306_005044 [Fusarium sp. DS 682]|nr:hypothetical protein IL306_005044 [Fusarium sp. DS 682]